MRKAMSRKGPRRSSSHGKSGEKGEVSSPTNAAATEGTEQNNKRKPVTEGEAVLTAKNYRLAKELSELRVRHREETKNVTRLTMENMNLASRCREAISHVSMLKKELTMHQRRAAEALAMQRQELVGQQQQQQQQGQRAPQPEMPKAIHVSSLPRNNTNGGISKTDVAAEMDRMDRLMAAHAPPPPPPITTALKDVIRPPTDDESPNGEFFSDYIEEKKTPSEEDMVGVSFNTTPIFPHSASPQATDRSNDYNEGFPHDLPPSSTRKKKLLSSIFREESPAEISEIESETGSVNGSVVSGVSAAETRKSILSSLDAFEASFATDFPHSFSVSPKEEEQPSVVYNPFLPSPARNDRKTPDLSEAEIVKARSGPAPPQVLSTSKNRSAPDENLSKMLPPRFSSSRIMPMESNRTNCSASPSTPSRSLREVTLPLGDTPQTPTRHSISPDDPSTPTSSIPHTDPAEDLEQPRRPEKTPSASARARYEKALQPRNYPSPRERSNSFRKNDNDDSDQQDSDPESISESELSIPRRTVVDVSRSRFRTQPSSPNVSSAPARSRSPSMVLKRMQERKLTSSPRVSKTAIPRKPESPLIPITSSQKVPSPRSARKTAAANSQKHASPMPSRTALPFPRTQPSPTLLPVSPSEVAAAPEGADLPAESPAKSTKSASTVSPSVSSAISAYERAAKRKDSITTPSGSRIDVPARSSARPSYRSSFTPKTARAASPKPFDEDDTMPTPQPGSATRSLSAREYQLDYGRRMADEERSQWMGSRPASEQELQFLAKRSSAYDRTSIRQEDSPPSSNENLHNSYPSRSNRMVASPEASKFDASGRSARRTVKQPVSYAEPSLNSKLRRGDTYFNKDQDDARNNGESGYHTASVRL